MKGWQYFEQPAALDEEQLVRAVLSISSSLVARGAGDGSVLFEQLKRRLFLLCVEVEHRLSGLGYDSGEEQLEA
jgi:hypothetical protein